MTTVENEGSYRYLVISGERTKGSPVVRRRYREVSFEGRKTKEQVVAYAVTQGWFRNDLDWVRVYQLVDMDVTPLLGDVRALNRRKNFSVVTGKA